MPTLRTFIAVELDRDLKAGLERVQDSLRQQLAPGSVRWVHPQSVHLTLKFLGDTPSEKVDLIAEALAQATARINPFTFTVGGLGCFPNSRRPRVVWAGLQDPSGSLARLRDAVEAEVAPLGFPTEARPFSPHLTLGRVQNRASKSELLEIGAVVLNSPIANIGQMAVTGVAYIKSDLRPSGSVYTTLAEASLAGAEQ